MFKHSLPSVQLTHITQYPVGGRAGRLLVTLGTGRGGTLGVKEQNVIQLLRVHYAPGLRWFDFTASVNHSFFYTVTEGCKMRLSSVAIGVTSDDVSAPAAVVSTGSLERRTVTRSILRRAFRAKIWQKDKIMTESCVCLFHRGEMSFFHVSSPSPSSLETQVNSNQQN